MIVEWKSRDEALLNTAEEGLSSSGLLNLAFLDALGCYWHIYASIYSSSFYQQEARDINVNIIEEQTLYL